MLRTNNKRLHSNLWTIAHFAGSALVFFGFFFMFVSIVYVPQGAYTTVVSSNLQFSIDITNLVNFSDAIKRLLPCMNFVQFVFGIGTNPAPILSKFLLLVSIGLDLVLWFNILLWALQLIVFVPDACFHWLEKKKED